MKILAATRKWTILQPTIESLEDRKRSKVREFDFQENPGFSVCIPKLPKSKILQLFSKNRFICFDWKKKQLIFSIIPREPKINLFLKSYLVKLKANHSADFFQWFFLIWHLRSIFCV